MIGSHLTQTIQMATSCPRPASERASSLHCDISRRATRRQNSLTVASRGRWGPSARVSTDKDLTPRASVASDVWRKPHT